MPPGSDSGGDSAEGGIPPPSRPEPADNVYRLLKVVLGGTTAVAFLIAYGFLSEGATFQFLGLPQLQANTFEMAEQGARNLIDSFGALGPFRSFFLLLLVLLVSWTWWQRSRSRRVYRCFASRRTIRWAQFLTLAALFLLMGSLVELRIQMQPIERIRMAERVLELRQWQRQQPVWDARHEYARIEALDFEVGPTRAACRLLERYWFALNPGEFEVSSNTVVALRKAMRPAVTAWQSQVWWLFDRACFTEEDYDRDGDSAPSGIADAAGINRRDTLAARKAARSAFGWLFMDALALLMLVWLVIGWRRWQQHEALVDVVRTSTDQAEAPNHGFYQASASFFEPLMVLVLMFCLALLPSAYGVLARGSVGMQPVMVRLDNRPECGGIDQLKPRKFETSRNDAPPDVIASTQRYDVRLGVRGRSKPGDSGDATADPSLAGSDNASFAPDWHLLTCSKNELDEVKKAIGRYRDAWEKLYELRPLDSTWAENTGSLNPESPSAYVVAEQRLEEETENLIEQASRSSCPEAYAEIWRALPREAEFTTRPRAASRVWERWTELQRTRSLVRFGYLIAYPRGEHSGRLLLGDLLSPPTPERPIRVSLQPVEFKCALGVELIPDQEAAEIRQAMLQSYAAPATAPVDVFENNPGASSLQAMMRLYRADILDHQRAGVLVSQIGLQAGRLRESNPLLHYQAVELLADAMQADMRLMDDPDGSEAMNGFAARRVEDLGAIATALHLAGGPWAARRVAGIVCGEPQGSKGAAVLEHCRRNDVNSVTRMPAERWNRLGTLVTASGYLAGDAHQAWRDLACASRIGRSANCRTESGLDAEWGQTERAATRDATLISAAVLERALASIALSVAEPAQEAVQQAQQTGRTHAHSLSNRRAACTALGLSGGGDQRYLDRALRELLSARDTDVLSYCLVHAPVNLSESLRKDLQRVVKGCWPDRANANDGARLRSAPCSDSPPVSLRVSALVELFEAGLYFDDETVYAALHASDSELRNAAAKFLEDVEPARMTERLWQCAQSRLSSRVKVTGVEANRMKANGFATTPEGKRCLRAWPLLALSEDGDGFYADAMARQLDHARNGVESLICDALEEMAARGGRIAFEKLSESGDKCKPAPEERDPRKRWMTNLMNFMTGDKDSNASEGNSTQGASTAGGEQDAPPTIVGDPAGDFDARVRAFLQLTQKPDSLNTIPLYDLLVEPPATALSYLAGQYLEDTTQEAVEASLLECAKDAKTEVAIRQRCVIGLAMTRTTYRLPDGSVDALWVGLALPELQSVTCRLAAEMSARQHEISVPTNCANRLPSMPRDATDRWRTHRHALLELLIDQRATHGLYEGETQSFHEEQLALLEAQDES